MSHINAQTIINAAMAAAALAPAYRDAFTIEAMPSGAPHGLEGFEEYAEIADIEGMPHGYCYAADQARKQAQRTIESMQDAAACALRALLDIPAKIKIQTAARGYMRIVNTRERLEAFAATVRSNAKAFGGGLVRAPKAKPAQAYSAGAVRMVRELLQDRDYAGALQLAESKAGALFYQHTKQAFMLLAPMACDELPGLMCAQHESGHYVVFEPVSGMAISDLYGTTCKTRARAIEHAASYWNSRSEDAKQAGMQRAMAAPCDKAAARAAWLAEHDISEPEDLAALHDAAAQDVAEVVAQASAAAAIEQAQESAALQDVAEVEATSEAAEVAQVETVCEASTGANGSTPAQQGRAAGITADYASQRAAGQTVKGKSGKWAAQLYRDAAGFPCLEFMGADGECSAHCYETGRERMQALQAMAQRADKAATCATTPGALSITITRAEGMHDECGKPVTVASFAACDAILRTWSETVRTGGTSDKVDFSITWPDGSAYDGTYLLRHHTSEAANLARHIIDFAEFETGLFCPAHMTQKAYENYLLTVSEESRAYFAGVLETLRSLGAYFPRVRPVAIDLRALVQSGIDAAQLVGLGVDYTPSHYSSNASEGAIVEAKNCTWHGVSVWVHLEDGRRIHAGALDFADGGAFRLNSKMHGAPYLAQLAAAVAMQEASAAAAKTQAQTEHAAELQKLATEYPQLKQAEGRHAGGKHAAVNVRILLKQEFKGTKFSVTSDYNSLRVSWTGGPTDAAVNALIGRFDIGAADYQTDYFYTVQTAWSELFGGVQYLNTHRTATEGEVCAALVSLFGEDGPSFEDWKAQKMWCQVKHGTRSACAYHDEWYWLAIVRRFMNGETDI